MANFCVGTLDSSVGFETQSVPEALSRHFTYWFASRRNQGKVMGSVPSWHYLFMRYSRTPDRLVEKVKEELESYMGELFSQRNVEVSFAYTNNTRTTYSVQISVTVISDGKTYDVGRTIQKTGEFYKILEQGN